MKEDVFHSPTLGIIPLEVLIVNIKKFIDENQEALYKLTIGTDSEIRRNAEGKDTLELITAIVIHRKGFGGKYFWKKNISNRTKSLRDKIYQEVLLSVDTAKYLVPELKLALSNFPWQYDLEIHIDVGENGATREMIKEVIGIVTGSGYIARTKPSSYAASNVADRHA